MGNVDRLLRYVQRQGQLHDGDNLYRASRIDLVRF